MTIKQSSVLANVLRWHDLMSRTFYQLGIFALSLIVVVYSYEVVSRYLFGAPTRWASDFVSFLLLITVFLVMPWLTRAGGHVAVTVLNDQLPERGRQVMLRGGYVVGAVACLCLGYIVYSETLTLYERGTGTLSTVSIPKWTLFMIVCYGLFNSGLYFLRRAVAERSVRKPAGEY
jgi:C4-dicarboxylate transporter DctQ subunit